MTKKNKLSIYECLQVNAIFDKLTQNDMFFFRKICRWYSEKFHTPLHEVMEGSVVGWDEILKHYYEYNIDSQSYNEIFELAMKEYLPEFADDWERQNEEFAKALIEEQKMLQEKAKKKKLKEKEKTEEDNKINNLPPPINMSFEDKDF